MNDVVCVVLLNYNGELDTIECLKSLEKIDYPYFNVLLVDNKSHPESVGKILSFLDDADFYDYDVVKEDELSDYAYHPGSNLLFVLNDDNYGFAGGNNVALNYVLTSSLRKSGLTTVSLLSSKT